MWSLIANATSGGLTPEVVGTILGAALGSAGTWYVARGRKAYGGQHSDDTHRVYLEDKFATREEVAELKRQTRQEFNDLHNRLNAITVKLNEMAGQQQMIIKILENRKSL